MGAKLETDSPRLFHWGLGLTSTTHLEAWKFECRDVLTRHWVKKEPSANANLPPSSSERKANGVPLPNRATRTVSRFFRKQLGIFCVRVNTLNAVKNVKEPTTGEMNGFEVSTYKWMCFCFAPNTVWLIFKSPMGRRLKRLALVALHNLRLAKVQIVWRSPADCLAALSVSKGPAESS